MILTFTDLVSYSALFFFPFVILFGVFNYIIKCNIKNKKLFVILLRVYKISCVILVMISSTGMMISLNKIYSLISFMYILESYAATMYIMYFLDTFSLKNLSIILLNILFSIGVILVLFYTVTLTQTLDVFNYLTYFCIFTYTAYPVVSVVYLFYFYTIIYNKEDALMTEVKDISDILEDDCSICLEAFSTYKVVELTCSHKFHKHCILKSLETKQECPLCRQEINV
jgi:hypothetical protein